MDYNVLITETAAWVKGYMDTHNSPELYFHNNTHTLEVVEAAKKISGHYKLPEEEYAIVIVASYFHDLGYFSGGRDGHEIRSADLAENFLKQRMADEEMITAVRNCIMATRLPQSPSNLLEQIVCDADLFHLGNDEFSRRNKLMRKEAEACYATDIDKDDWRKGTIKLMESHHYHTDYSRSLLDNKKQQNLESLKMKEADESGDNHTGNGYNKQKDKKNKDDKNQRPERGIETMFRITSTNNQRLSDMADNKANILITVNSIILSAIIALLLRKLDSNEHLMIPTFMLLAISLCTIVVAILATRPHIPDGRFTKQDVKDKSVNLLFFGNFYRMRLDDYNAGMLEVMGDRDFLYGTLTKDVYSQGVVLGRKYRLLRLAYNIFMFGLVASVLTFIMVIVIDA